MQIEFVRAHAFGPFNDETLELAPRMTVIHGRNESGKSSWHAALYAGLCGVRRRRGRGNREDQYFKDRHRPWAGDAWEVSAMVRLSDGRRVELHHDLDGKVDCWAQDVDMGRDYSSDVIYDGAPDGSRWLGLNRRSFLTTACVRQADIQSVMEGADALKEELQRAAATAGTDSTAAAALNLLVDFRRENVGQDRANSVRPLRATRNRYERALQHLEEANASHENYLSQLEEIERLRREKDGAERSLQLVEAAWAMAQAERREKEARRARKLSVKYQEEPPSRSQGNEVVESVNTALALWSKRPDAVKLEGKTAEELCAELDQLPLMPEGDTKPHKSVADAKDQYSLARSVLDRHRECSPSVPTTVDAGGLDAAHLRELAAELALEEPSIDPQIEERVARASKRVEELRDADLAQSPKESRSIPLILRPVTLLIRMILAPFRALFMAARHSAAQEARIKQLEEQRKAEAELREAEDQLGNIRHRLEEVRRRHSDAEDEAASHALSIEPQDLTRLARQVEQAGQLGRDLKRWEDLHEQYTRELGDAETLLCNTLRERGVLDTSPPVSAMARYEKECLERARETREASRRPDLERAYRQREIAESHAEDSARRRREAAEGLHAAAKATGVTEEDDEDEIAARLEKWRHIYHEDLRRLDRAHSEWNELQGLVDGGSLQELEQDAVSFRGRAEQLTVGLETEEIERVTLEEDVAVQVEGLRKAVSDSSRDLAANEGSIKQYSSTMQSVPEAEEELQSAEAERRRVERLSQTLDYTRIFLERAQDRVHRTVAPLLRDAIKPWLRQVTNGRYTDARIDAGSLLVRVSGDGRNWREVPLLSHGTAEQVYLLLRIVMARLLTREGETCPLILDDVTVNFDPQRQTEVMNILHTVSEEQQVIVFSQEPEISLWAQEHLVPPHDLLVELPLSEIQA